MIVQELFNLQRGRGFLDKNELRALSARLAVPLYRLEEVASFFPHFRFTAPPQVHVQVCHDMACHRAGACELKAGLQRLADDQANTPMVVGNVSCLGRCDRAPTVLINGEPFLGRTLDELQTVCEAYLAGSKPHADHDATLARHSSNPWQIDVYAGEPAYSAVKEYVAQPDPQRVFDALKAADLRGMGGAGVWAHQKWSDVLGAKGSTKYIVCNADESEPSTFKDRELLLRTPHLVLEGVIMAGLVTGAKQGFIYIRHEYEEQIEHMNAAIEAARRMRICGDRILGTDRSFTVEVFTSPGGYICGEQSALIEAMEDRRAQPRNKPPQLETNGLYDKPTLVSNVETFAWVPAILVKGAQWYAGQGHNGCKGLRFFSICGDVERPGVFEVANGTSLRDLLAMAGGMRAGRPLKAVAPSGPSGGFMPARVPLTTLARGWEERMPAEWMQAAITPGASDLDVLDLPLDLQRFRDLGLMLGAGLAVYSDDADIVSEALNCLEFFRNESCGKCVPCRIGSQKIVEITTDLVQGRFDNAAWQGQTGLVDELARTMELTSICGLGVVAPQPLVSLIKSFPADVKAYLKERPAGTSGKGQ